MAKKLLSRKRRRQNTNQNCDRCQNQSAPETFWYMAQQYLFDVDLARKLVAHGRRAVELDDTCAQFSVDTSELDPEHVKHVDPSIPGIVAHVQYVTKEGERLRGHLLIDGHHRAARCLQLNQPFLVHVLSESESRDILLRSPCEFVIEQEDRETFSYYKRLYEFDVTRAIHFAHDGREAVEVDEEDVRDSLDDVRINDEHLPNVDPKKPGIIAHVFFAHKDGTQVKGHRLIDGHHRAARCLELGLPFRAYLLNEEESAAILLRSPCKPALDPAACIGIVSSHELRTARQANRHAVKRNALASKRLRRARLK